MPLSRQLFEALYLRALTRKPTRRGLQCLTQAPCNHGPSCPHLPIMHYSSDGNLHLGFVLDSGVVRQTPWMRHLPG
jgi:hypothetical protein